MRREFTPAHLALFKRRFGDAVVDHAMAVYDILRDEAGADEGGRELLVFWLASGHDGTEYRFMGKLGFGGKLWVRTKYVSEDQEPVETYDVTCYPEDTTPERQAMMQRTNERLSKLTPYSADA